MMGVIYGLSLIGLSFAQSLPSQEVSRELPANGAHWTQWSTYYGCSQFRYDEFCRFPERHKLQAGRYRICTLVDGRNFPDNLFDNQKPQGQSLDYFTGSDNILGMFQKQIEESSAIKFLNGTDFTFTNEEEFMKVYDQLDLSSLVPQTGDPFDQISSLLLSSDPNNDLNDNTKLQSTFEFTDISTYNDDEFCGDVELVAGDSKTRLSQNCLNLNLASTNIACDPRIETYAADNGKTAAEIVDLIQSQETTSADVIAVKTAIPSPYLVFQTATAICDDLAEQCPKPLPWTSWNCHCPQGSDFQSNDIFTNGDNPDNLPLCECGSQKRRRYQLCKDGDLSDTTTCQSVGQSISDIQDYNDKCLIDQAETQWWRPYLPKKNLVENYDPTKTNWYQLSTWKQSREDKDAINLGKPR